MMGEYNTAIATYQGDMLEFFQAIAFNLQVPTEDQETGKPLIAKDLKNEIIKNCNEYTLLILPKVRRLTSGLKYWVEKMKHAGAIVVCLSVVKPKGDIFLEMLEIELDLPSNKVIREIMKTEAEILGLNLTKADLAELQPLAGRNPILARKVINNRALDIKQTAHHTQYVNIAPIFYAVLVFFVIMKFVGMGTRNRQVQIFGGVIAAVGMSAKQLGSIKASQKRLGQ